jgi:integral membrane protein
MRSTNTFSLFRKIAFAEGVSFMVLLLLAMPLKYFANLPLAVTVVGGIHGFLFVAFMALALAVIIRYKKSIGWLLASFVASIIPLGTFWMDHTKWKKEEAALIQQKAN